MHLYTIHVSPISDRDRAMAIVRRLRDDGFVKTNVTTQPAFRVVSEPLPKKAAEALNATLAGRGFHSHLEPLAGDAAQLVFGTFNSEQEANPLAQRIAAAGYDAWVRAVNLYTLQIGPYLQSSIAAISGIIKSGAQEATITADPAGLPAGAPPAGSTLQPSPPSSPSTPPPAVTRPQNVPAAPARSAGADHVYFIRIVLADGERASGLAKQLMAAGFSQGRVTQRTGFRVVSEPLPRSAADTLSATLTKRGFECHVERLAGDTARCLFGTFASQQEADTLAQRIGAAGYDAWVRGGLVVYLLEFGEYSRSSVNAITELVKSDAPEATLSVIAVP